MMKNKEYIESKLLNSKHFIVSNIEVFIKDEVTNDVSPRKVIKLLLSKIPSHLMANVKSIHIGDFDYLQKRKIQAVYAKSNIYVTSKQDSELDMLDDLIHEVAHSVEEVYQELIYSDGKVKAEFLNKRKKLWMKLKDLGFEISLEKFLDVSYDEKTDAFLYTEVGYKTIRTLASDLFFSPYGATSLREYFANGFEAFFMKEELSRLKDVSPAVYEKNIELLNIGD